METGYITNLTSENIEIEILNCSLFQGEANVIMWIICLFSDHTFFFVGLRYLPI